MTMTSVMSPYLVKYSLRLSENDTIILCFSHRQIYRLLSRRIYAKYLDYTIFSLGQISSLRANREAVSSNECSISLK